MGLRLQVVGGAEGKRSGRAQHYQSLRKKTASAALQGWRAWREWPRSSAGTWQMGEPGVLFGCFHKYEDLGRGKHSRLDLGDPVVGGRA